MGQSALRYAASKCVQIGKSLHSYEMFHKKIETDWKSFFGFVAIFSDKLDVLL